MDFFNAQERQMKETLAEILQMRMDKCTSEQFWATGAVGALDAFLITQHDEIKSHLPPWAVVMFACIALGYAIYFIVHRHVAYYSTHKLFVELLRNDPETPDAMKADAFPWKGHSWSGVTFYVGVVASATLGVLVSYLG